MLKIDKDFDFKGLQINKLLKATYYASHNFQYRALFKARDDILKIGKYSNEELEMVLNSILDAETARKYIIEELKTSNILKASEIINRFQFPKEEVIRDLYYMKEKGLIEDIESNLNDLIFKFKVPLKEIKENYFNSVNSVYDNNLCCQCGLCSSVCPVNAVNLTKDYLYIDENRCITCGLCYDLCPCSFKMDNLWESLSKMDKSLKYSEGIGYYRNIYSARTLKYSIRKVGQDGGVVTSLLYYLLEKDLVDAIITIKHLENYWEPEVGIIERVDELYKTAGTTYVHFPVLSILHQAKKFERIAVVALPCKMKALSKGE
ncbi:MAG: coenzyme F420 hydrogenase/dehydrogenase beta subunit N-terminal domain-containing protein, partial [Candidatus Thorarchaeota archaeon]